MKGFGASAPYKELYKKFGLTEDNVAQRAKDLIAFWAKKGAAPSLVQRPF